MRVIECDGCGVDDRLGAGDNSNKVGLFPFTEVGIELPDEVGPYSTCSRSYKLDLCRKCFDKFKGIDWRDVIGGM